eukprot:scaffold27322_cov63-Phaeocystis_antarctica.AAC.2
MYFAKKLVAKRGKATKDKAGTLVDILSPASRATLTQRLVGWLRQRAVPLSAPPTFTRPVVPHAGSLTSAPAHAHSGQ